MSATVDSDQITIRRLEFGDKSKGFFTLLSQLSPSPPLSDANFSSLLADLTSLANDHLVVVAEDIGADSGKIIATGAVYIERKFIHGGGKVGHIEDVVVDAAARGRGIGQKIVQHLVDYARAVGCYKVILDCTQELKVFYEHCGFEEKNIQMAVYFNH